MENKKNTKKTSEQINSHKNYYLALGIILILVAIFNIVQTSSFNSLLDERLAAVKEATKPAELQMITITDYSCNDCFDIQPIIDTIKKSHVNITQEQSLNFDSEEAKELISEYGIEKIPSVLLFGQINKTSIRNMEPQDDALVFKSLIPPYTDAITGELQGRVSTILVQDSSCDNCYNLDVLLNSLKQSGVVITSERTVEMNSVEGQGLISQYSIQTIPTLILSSDLEIYGSGITGSWTQLGSVESNGYYVTRLSNPPYVDLTENRVVGLLSMTVITDETCTECYDPNSFHKPILVNMGAVFGEEKSVDISTSEGQTLIEKYNIEKVPTIILEGDVGAYSVIVSAWKDVGTVETDGTYVFRLVDVSRQPYKDLTTGEIVQP